MQIRKLQWYLPLLLIAVAGLSACGSGASQQNVKAPSSNAPVVVIGASPGSVSSGGSSTLTWSATNATSCTASGAWSGSEPTSGSQSTAKLTANATYTLSCTGAGGTTTQSTTVAVTVPSCSATSGALVLNAKVSRASGVSPLLVFFDATGTTDAALTGNTTAFQDVTYTWSFGDSGASGTGTWAYGSNPGKNSMNSATGGIAAHLYIVPEGAGDTSHTATVTATDGTNTASCSLATTTYDAAGSSGFPGTATTCVYSDGSLGSGCPAGANTLSTASFATALGATYFGNGKRVLFKCGDTFSGDNVGLTATNFAIGAYGGCQGTTSGRPIFSDSGSSGLLVARGNAVNDGRVMDIDFEGAGTGSGSAFSIQLSSANGTPPSQVTWYNLNSNNVVHAYSWWDGTQMGIISSTMQNLGNGAEGVYPNFNGNNCVSGSPNGSAYNCGHGGSGYVASYYVNVAYSAILGNMFNGASYSSGYETFRMEACRMCVIANNTIENAGGSSYAVLKLHNGNTNNSSATWTGQYTELMEISDNLFTGNSGGQLVEVCPQNGQTDERLQNIVIERNVFAGTKGGNKALSLSANNASVRDNVFYNQLGGAGIGASVAKRGIEYTGTAAAPSDASAPQFVELYNNTCYGGSSCIGLQTNQGGWGQPGSNSWAVNNLMYSTSGGSVVNSSGSSGNTISNNTPSVTANPGWANGSGTFLVISDYQPSANYSGGTSVAVFYDALGKPWSGIWDLGAVQP